MRARRSGPSVQAPCAHSRVQRPQPTQRAASTCGWTDECIAFLPARDPQPMPRFLSAPPMPVISWHLKWLSEMTTSASTSARPMKASFTYLPSGSGTATSSVPRRPSAMRIGQPTENGEKPFSQASSRCSSASFRRPT